MKLGLIILCGIAGVMLFSLSGLSNIPMMVFGIILFVIFVLSICHDAERT